MEVVCMAWAKEGPPCAPEPRSYPSSPAGLGASPPTPLGASVENLAALGRGRPTMFPCLFPSSRPGADYRPQPGREGAVLTQHIFTEDLLYGKHKR